MECPNCHGWGWIQVQNQHVENVEKDHCWVCDGTGEITVERFKEVWVDPAPTPEMEL